MRVIDNEGRQIGILETKEALRRAEEEGLDLVEVAPTAEPPVCRIMDYSKYKYEQSKRAKEAQKKQKVIEVKEIKLKPKIEEHDYQVKLSHIIKFLKKGDRVKISLRFRGREITHPDIGRHLLERIINDCKEYSRLAKEPTLFDKTMVMFLEPR